MARYIFCTEQEDVVGQALVQVQEIETNLPPLHLAVLLEVLENPIKAKVYLLTKRRSGLARG